MSLDIDMKSYTGEIEDSVAANPQQVDANSYHQEVSDAPLGNDLGESSLKTEVIQDQAKEANPQSEHFRALREELNRMKAEKELEKREHQMQIDMLRANVESRHKSEDKNSEKKFFEGLTREDMPNVGEIEDAWARREEAYRQREEAYQQRLEELTVAQTYPDYAEVLEKYLTPLIRQKPHFAEMIKSSQNKAYTAYEIGLMAKHMEGNKAQTIKSDNAQRIVENSRKPGTLSQAGGQSTLSKADYFASMSDSEFLKFAQRNLDGI